MKIFLSIGGLILFYCWNSFSADTSPSDTRFGRTTEPVFTNALEQAAWSRMEGLRAFQTNALAAQFALEQEAVKKFNATNSAAGPEQIASDEANSSSNASVQPALPQQIQITESGALAEFGPHKVLLAPSPDTEDAVSIQIPSREGLENLKSHVVGIGFWDIDSGDTALFAQPKECVGQVQGTTVVYPNAFEGIDADLSYVYSAAPNIASFEQNVILRQKIPDPITFSLTNDPARIRLVVISEMTTLPNVIRVTNTIDLSSHNLSLGVRSEASIVDETLYVGSMRMPAGRSVLLGTNSVDVPSAKTLIHADGHWLLIEYTPWPLIKALIDSLPSGTLHAQVKRAHDFESLLAQVSKGKIYSKSDKGPKASNARLSRGLELAQDNRPGVLLDYILTSSRLLNINFGGANPPKQGIAAVGQTATDVWKNWYYPGSSHTEMNLPWSDNVASPVTVTVQNATGAWGNDSTDPMYNSYVYPGPGGNLTITITGLPTDNYNFYLYGHEGHADNPRANAKFQLWRAGTQIGYKGTTLWGNAFATTNWEPGQQFQIFTNVSVNNQQIQIIVPPGGDGYAYINGMQIAPSSAVPPSSPTISKLININVGDDFPAKVGYAAVGRTANDAWNTYWDPSPPSSRAPSYSMANLVDSAGNQTTSGMVIQNAQGAWYFSAGDSMYNGYTYTLSGGSSAVILTNLQAGNYDFYLYGHAGSDNASCIFELWSGTRPWGKRGTSIWGSEWNSLQWNESQQFIVFHDVWVEPGQAVTILANPGDSGAAYFNGMQVVYKGPADSNGNNLPDAWENYYFGNLSQLATGDPDADWLKNRREYELGFNPKKANSDFSSLNDWQKTDIQWLKDQSYAGGTANGVGNSDMWSATVEPWTWTSQANWNGNVISSQFGNQIHISDIHTGTHLHWFERATNHFMVKTGDMLYAWVNIDRQNPPSEIMLQWQSAGDQNYPSWEHRAYWGANTINWGVSGTTSRNSMGTLDTWGSQVWTKLQVPAASVGLEGKIIQGLAFVLYGGRAAWDTAGIFTPDMDGNGLPDAWEIANFGHIGVDPNGDPEPDGLTNLQEYQAGSDPHIARPLISQQPVDATRLESEGVTFSVVASGQAPVSYVWRKNGAIIVNGPHVSGATTATLTLSSLSAADAGVYTVDVINPGGTRTSSPALLKVCPAGLTVNAYKRSCEDKFYFDVYNVSGVSLQGSTFKLLVYFVTSAGTYYAMLLPWGPSDVLPQGGGHHLFTMCNSDHSITNYYCAVIYDNGSTCLSSPKFQIAGKTDLALLFNNTTQARNFCTECPPCPGGEPEWMFPLNNIVHLNCPFGEQLNCQPDPCGTWPLTAPMDLSLPYSLPISAHDGPSSQILDNYYKASSPAVNVDRTCPKHGFKNVYAIKQWHGAFGPMSDVPSPTLSSMTGDMNCETGSQPINTPDLTKYLIASSQGTYERHYVYRACEPCQVQDYPTYGSVSRFCSVDKNTGKKTYGGSNNGDYRDATDAIPDLRLKDLPGIYRDRVESIMPSLKGLPGPDGPVDVTPVFSPNGGVPSVTWLYTWDFMGGGEENGAPCTITRNGSYSGTISLDLAGGTLTYRVDYAETFSWACDDDGTSGSSTESSSRTETISMTATTVSRETAWENRSHYDGCESGIDDDWGSTSGSVSYTLAYTSDQVNSDTDTLLSKWNLVDNIEYPWRSDGDTSSGPLVTQNERGATAPDAVFPLLNVGTEEDPVWQLPTDTSLPPWPSQNDGVVLGAPLPVHGPGGELYAYEPYYNFYHKNWTFEETGRGSPQGFVDSYGAPSPYPNATQWLDKDEARCFPAGPFWAYGSEIEGGGDHFMFRFKDPYITDTDGEWEQGGYGGGCLIKCKWAETISPVSPQGEDFVFKQWHYNFRDFISSYDWNVGAWSRNNIEIPGGSTCSPLSYVTPVRYTPIDIPVGQPWAGYYIGPGSWYVSQMDCTALQAGRDCCQTAVYVEPNPPGSACNNGVGDGLFVAMPTAVCDARFGSLWMGRVDQTTPDSHVCDNYVANRNNGVGNPDACEPQIEIDPIFHSHNHAYETFVAPLTFPSGSQTTLDLDIDSDNNNGYNAPARSAFEDQIEDDSFRPGKIVWLNTGDYDLDGIPDFADGFDWDGVSGNDDDANTPATGEPNNRFVPLVLQVGNGVNVDLARLRITYSASDPAGVTHDGNPPVWRPAPGNLRIWKKNADQSRNKNSARAGGPGDFVEPGVYSLSQLGIVGGSRMVTLYVEGVQVSADIGDQRILVELDPDGDGPEGWNLSDAVRVTVIGAQFVEAVGDKAVQPCTVLSDSHAAPYFDVTRIDLSQPQLDPDGNLLGNIAVIGTIRSDLSDLIKGDAGKLGDILVSVNGEPLTADGSSIITVHKSDGDPNNPSLTHPYATSTEFTLVFNNAKVSPGLNWLRLAVADSVPGSGLTGFAEYSWVVTARPIIPTGPNPAEPNPPNPPPNPQWSFENSPPTEISKNGRGEIHPYYIQLNGANSAVRSAAQLWPRTFVKGADGNYYFASDRDTPEVHVLTAFQKIRDIPIPTGPFDQFAAELGFYHGFIAQGVDDVKGTLKFGLSTVKFLKVSRDIQLGSVSDYDVRALAEFGTNYVQLCAMAKATWNLWNAGQSTMVAAAMGNLDETWQQSESLRWFAAYMVEAMVAINNEYAEGNAFKKGEVMGRVTLEVAMIVLPLTKVAQLSKIELLTRLTNIQWIKDDTKLSPILKGVLDTVKARPTVLPPPAWAEAGERAVAAAELEIRNGAPLADTISNI